MPHDLEEDLQLVRDVAAGRVTPDLEPWVFDDDLLSFAVGRLERSPGGPERLAAALLAPEVVAAGRALAFACLSTATRARVAAGLEGRPPT